MRSLPRVHAAVSVGRMKSLLFPFRPKFEIYTDGSSKDGRGAWAYVLVRRSRGPFARGGTFVREGSGAVRKASSNPMEFRAAIEALKSLNAETTATLFSDSRILIDTMTVWQGNAELRPRGLETEIAELDRLTGQHKITWKWIRAHAGHEFNERCDLLCIQAREKLGPS